MIEQYKSETRMQELLMNWVRKQALTNPDYDWAYHTANEAKRSPALGATLKRMGLRKGISDLCFPICKNGKHGLYLELKNGRKAKIQPEQLEFGQIIEERGYQFSIAYDLEEAKKIIKEYIESA